MGIVLEQDLRRQVAILDATDVPQKIECGELGILRFSVDSLQRHIEILFGRVGDVGGGQKTLADEVGGIRITDRIGEFTAIVTLAGSIEQININTVETYLTSQPGRLAAVVDNIREIDRFRVEADAIRRVRMNRPPRVIGPGGGPP